MNLFKFVKETSVKMKNPAVIGLLLLILATVKS